MTQGQRRPRTQSMVPTSLQIPHEGWEYLTTSPVCTLVSLCRVIHQDPVSVVSTRTFHVCYWSVGQEERGRKPWNKGDEMVLNFNSVSLQTPLAPTRSLSGIDSPIFQKVKGPLSKTISTRVCHRCMSPYPDSPDFE